MWRMPEKTEWAKEQNAHKPTLEYGREIYEIVKEYQPNYKSALEIGCAWGVSALAILMAGEGKLISVDPNQANHAIEEVEVNGFKDRWTYLPIKSEQYWKDVGGTFDVIYVDGSHKHPTCTEDLIEGWERLNPGGILVADDFTHPANQKVDTDGTTVEYGVSFAVCNLICEKRLTKIASTTRLFVGFK